ncbi:unnamed protein product [Caretta caretta]
MLLVPHQFLRPPNLINTELSAPRYGWHSVLIDTELTDSTQAGSPPLWLSPGFSSPKTLGSVQLLTMGTALPEWLSLVLPKGPASQVLGGAFRPLASLSPATHKRYSPQVPASSTQSLAHYIAASDDMRACNRSTQTSVEKTLLCLTMVCASLALCRRVGFLMNNEQIKEES